MYLLLLNKNPRFNNNPPLFKRKFSDFENMLNNNPPLSTKNIDNNYYVFSSFLARIFTTIIHFLKRIRHYESRCQADDPLLLFHLIVFKAQLELVPWQSLS